MSRKLSFKNVDINLLYSQEKVDNPFCINHIGEDELSYLRAMPNSYQGTNGFYTYSLDPEYIRKKREEFSRQFMLKVSNTNRIKAAAEYEALKIDFNRSLEASRNSFKVSITLIKRALTMKLIKRYLNNEWYKKGAFKDVCSRVLESLKYESDRIAKIVRRINSSLKLKYNFLYKDKSMSYENFVKINMKKFHVTKIYIPLSLEDLSKKILRIEVYVYTNGMVKRIKKYFYEKVATFDEYTNYPDYFDENGMIKDDTTWISDSGYKNINSSSASLLRENLDRVGIHINYIKSEVRYLLEEFRKTNKGVLEFIDYNMAKYRRFTLKIDDAVSDAEINELEILLIKLTRENIKYYYFTRYGHKFEFRY